MDMWGNNLNDRWQSDWDYDGSEEEGWQDADPLTSYDEWIGNVRKNGAATMMTAMKLGKMTGNPNLEKRTKKHLSWMLDTSAPDAL